MEYGTLSPNNDFRSSSPLNYKIEESPERSSYQTEAKINLSPFYRKSNGMNGHNRQDTQATHYSNFSHVLGSTYKLLDEIKANSTKNTTNALKFSHIKSPTRSSLSLTFKSPLKTSFYEQRSPELMSSQGRKSFLNLPKKDSKMVIEESYKLISEIKSSLQNSRATFAKYENHTAFLAQGNVYTEPDAQTDHRKSLENRANNKSRSSVSPKQGKNKSDPSMHEESSFSGKYLTSPSPDDGHIKDKDTRSRINRDAKNGYNNLVNEVLQNLENRNNSPLEDGDHEYGLNSNTKQNKSTSRRYQEENASMDLRDPMSYSTSPKQDENLRNSFGSSYLKNSVSTNSKRIDIPMNSKAEPFDPLADALDIEEDSPKPNSNLTYKPQPQPTVQNGKITLTLTSYYPKPKEATRNSFQKSYDGLRNSKVGESTSSLKKQKGLKESQEILDSYRSNNSMKSSNTFKKGQSSESTARYQQDKSNVTKPKVSFY